jgi:antitoxin MazE
MTKNATVQKWGNSLAVRIPVDLARSAWLVVGQPVELSAQDGGLLMVPVGEPELSLSQMLASFDPDIHGGEVMAAHPIGREVNS